MDAFIGILEQTYGPNVWRKINVFRNSKGKKTTKNARSNWTPEQISDNRGHGNCYDLYIKHCRNDEGKLVCFDFDDMNYKNNPLYNKLVNKGAIETTSKHGAHLYASVLGIPDFSNEVKVQKMYKGPEGRTLEPDTDLIVQKRNMWELFNEECWSINLRAGSIVNFRWDELNEFFDLSSMNMASAKKSTDSKSDMKKSVSQEQDFIKEKTKNISRCALSQFKSYLDRLLPHRYKYDSFIDVGIMCWVNFEGSTQGFGCWLEWNGKDTTEHDNERDLDYLTTKWRSFTDDKEFVSDWRKLKKWADEDTPINPYEELYRQGGKDALIDELNTGKLLGTLIGYNQMTSEFIIQNPQGWMLKSDRQATIHFEAFNFVVESEDDDKSYFIQPFKLWRNSIKRNTWYEIVYDPSGQETGSFNLWRGYKMTKANTERYNENDCQPILDHLMNIWADGCQDTYDYVLNWFAWKLQRPHKKMAVVLCLNSGEGAGKNVVLNHMYKIMGSNYDSVSTAKSILGDFNGILEGKTLLNFDEVTYGGNHEKNNQLKALISEDYVHINKKNKEMYRIRSMADFVITTNEDYFIGVTGDSRRYCPIKLNQKWVGIQNDATASYFEKIQKASSEAFAKFLYNRDISDFNPRQFKKTELFQQQVEKSFPSPIRWLYQSLESGHIVSMGASKFIEWCKLPPHQNSNVNDFQWETYGNQQFGNDFNEWRKIAFNHKRIRWYRINKIYDIYSRSKMGSYSKVVTEQKFSQTLLEVFPDMKTRSHPKLGMCCQLPELAEGRQQFNVWCKWDYKWTGNDGDFAEEDADDILFTEEWEDETKETAEKNEDLLRKMKAKGGEKQCHL